MKQQALLAKRRQRYADPEGSTKTTQAAKKAIHLESAIELNARVLELLINKDMDACLAANLATSLPEAIGAYRSTFSQDPFTLDKRLWQHIKAKGTDSLLWKIHRSPFQLDLDALVRSGHLSQEPIQPDPTKTKFYLRPISFANITVLTDAVSIYLNDYPADLHWGFRILARIGVARDAITTILLNAAAKIGRERAVAKALAEIDEGKIAQLKTTIDPDKPVQLLYMGMTTAGTPGSRAENDMKAAEWSRNNNFIHSTRSKQVPYLITGLTAEAPLGTLSIRVDDLADCVEGALIAIPGGGGLNSALGGLNPQYIPSISDQMVVQAAIASCTQLDMSHFQFNSELSALVSKIYKMERHFWTVAKPNSTQISDVGFDRAKHNVAGFAYRYGGAIRTLTVQKDNSYEDQQGIAGGIHDDTAGRASRLDRRTRHFIYPDIPLGGTLDHTTILRRFGIYSDMWRMDRGLDWVDWNARFLSSAAVALEPTLIVS